MNRIDRANLIIAAVLAAGLVLVGAPAMAQPDEGSALNAKVEELYRDGKFVEAIPLAQQALAIRERTLGPNHPDVATSLTNLALLYASQRRYAEAEPLYRRALAIRAKVQASADATLSRPSAQIEQLIQLLSADKTDRESLEENLAQLRANLGSAESERDRFKALYESLSRGGTSAGQVIELANQVEAEKRRTEKYSQMACWMTMPGKRPRQSHCVTVTVP
jgi:tetratricopeptide (TPR) repeat protein